MKTQTLSRINYTTDSEVYAKVINSHDLLGFITSTDSVYEINSGVTINPTEQRLKNALKEVLTLPTPIQNVFQI